MKKQIIIGNKIFKTQTECEKYARSILTELGIINSVKLKNEEYFNFLMLLCKRHPRWEEKSIKFIDFQIYKDALNNRGLALNIVNNDNTRTEISWLICIKGESKSVKANFNSALRQCISSQIKEFRDSSDLSCCKICNCSLSDARINIDHHEIQFKKLVEDFIELKNIIIPTEYNKKPVTFEKLFKDEDTWIGKLFEKYHLQNATLRVLCESCNQRREKYKDN